MSLDSPALDSLGESAYPGPWRWLQAGGFAVVLHGMVFWLLLAVSWHTYEADPATTVNVVLVPAKPESPPPITPEQTIPEQIVEQVAQPPPEPIPEPISEPPPDPPATVVSEQPVPAASAESTTLVDEVTEFDEQKQETILTLSTPPNVSSARILAHIGKYRLHDDKLLEDLPEGPVEPLNLGHINRQDLLAMLDKPLPNLPFADPDTPFVFYSTGFQGEVEKFFDKITKRTSHTTKWGTKIECAYTLIIVICGYG